MHIENWATMRKQHQRFFLLMLSLTLCAFFLHKKWKHQNHFVITHPQYSPAEAHKHRQATLKSVCVRNNLNSSSFVLNPQVASRLYVEHSHKFIYCEVPKVGCSNWKRIILLLNDSLGRAPKDLRHYAVHTSKSLIKLSTYPQAVQKELLANYTKVLFTRDPLERVVSAYRDKFLHEDDVYYFKTIGNQIKRTLGIDKKYITFQQFVEFISEENPDYRDIHWKPMYQLCDPCKIQYDFIGKFSTITDDSDFVLEKIGAPKHLKYPTLKHHYNDSRTSDDITIQYLEMLPPVLFRKLVKLYSHDFSLFDYSIYNSTVTKLPKTT